MKMKFGSKIEDNNNKINSENIMMQVSFIGVRVFLGKKKKIFSKLGVIFFENPI